MSRILNILVCIIKSKKIFYVKKKKFAIFDCVNSEILAKILPNDQTCVISARVHLIKEILVNFKTLSFVLKNLFSRSIQLNYFISLIKQIEPKFVLTTIDNSINFSLNKNYDICFVNKIIFDNGEKNTYKTAKDSFVLLNFLSKYINKYNKKILIQTRLL